MEKVFGVKNQQKKREKIFYIHIYVFMYKQELVHKMYLIQKNCFLYNT